MNKANKGKQKIVYPSHSIQQRHYVCCECKHNVLLEPYTFGKLQPTCTSCGCIYLHWINFEKVFRTEQQY